MEYKTTVGPKIQALLRVSSQLEKKAAQVPSNVEFSLDPILKTRLPSLREEVDSLIKRLCVLNGTWKDQPTEVYKHQSDHVHQMMEQALDTLAILTRRIDRSFRLLPSRSGPHKRSRPEDAMISSLPLGLLLKKRRVGDNLSRSARTEESKASSNTTEDDSKHSINKTNGGQDETQLRLCNIAVCRVPRITEKPNAIEGIPAEIEKWQRALPARVKEIEAKVRHCIRNSDDVVNVETYMSLRVPDEYKDTTVLPHPYQPELDAMQRMYTNGEDEWGYEIGNTMQAYLFDKHRLIPYQDISDSPSPITVVDGVGIQALIDSILSYTMEEESYIRGDPYNKVPVLAVDLEHHSTNSYRGVTCLMQLTFGNQDYIVDTLAVPKCHLSKLNQVFSNPAILKILHGSHYDVLWLQELADLYLINVFDTYFASKLLKTPGGNGLAAIVELYCNVKLDKGLQMSDWRQRPLTEEMIHYARSDTHYLPYIFSCMRNQLLTRPNENDLSAPVYDPELKVTSRGMLQMMWVLEQSRQLCHNRVSYDIPNFSSKAMKIKTRFCTTLETDQTTVLTRLLAWRDLQARKADMAPSSVLPERLLLSIAQKMPRTQSDLHRVLGLSVIKFPKSNLMKVLSLVSHTIPHHFNTPQIESVEFGISSVPVSSGPSIGAPSSLAIPTPQFTTSLSPVAAEQRTVKGPGADLSLDPLPVTAESLHPLPSIILRGAFLRGRNLRVFTTKKTKRHSGSRQLSSGLGKLIRAIFG